MTQLDISFIEARAISNLVNQLFSVAYEEAMILPFAAGLSVCKYFETIDETETATYAIISTEPLSDTALFRLEQALQIHDVDMPLNARFVIIHADEELETEPLITASLLIDYQNQYDSPKDQALYLAINHDRFVDTNCNAVGLYDENDNLQYFFIADLLLELPSASIS